MSERPDDPPRAGSGSRPADDAAELEARLDEALRETFPASDPIAITPPVARRSAERNADCPPHRMNEHGAKRTHDHDEIRAWVEERDGHPASVRGTWRDGAGVLRIDFEGAGAGEEELRPLSWDEFFRKFDEADLDFLYQDLTARGSTSRFCKFVDRE